MIAAIFVSLLAVLPPMRGHIRELTDADRALFDPPSDYTPIQ
jgi:hypothetical protein